MSNAASSIIAAMAEVNSALAPVLLPENARCFLAYRGENTNAFTATELTSGWFIEFDENRTESGLFSYATTSSFSDSWSRYTHVLYGVAESSRIEVYEFVQDEKDTINPTGTSPFWSGRIVKIPNERYTIS
jgi:hypothetical protein